MVDSWRTSMVECQVGRKNLNQSYPSWQKPLMKVWLAYCSGDDWPVASWWSLSRRQLVEHGLCINLYACCSGHCTVLNIDWLWLFHVYFPSFSNSRQIIMATLWNRAGHYIFALWFLLLSSIFLLPRLISAVAELISTILLHLVWP